MDCTHEKLRCTDNRFFCLLCGAEVEAPKPPEEKAKEPEKPKRKRGAKTNDSDSH